MNVRDLFFERYRYKDDEYGFNLEAYVKAEILFRFLYEKWFDVQIVGLENIPADGRAVLFGNHSGVLPLDAFMLYEGMINHHPDPRRIRFLVTKFLLDAPEIGGMLRGFGCVPAGFEIAVKLLQNEELVFFYPEAEKGPGKLFKDRYNLVDFHSGFVTSAIKTNSVLVPIATVGGEETYPMLANIKPLARLMNAPYWPVTPLYPWLPFPLNAIPLPIKMLICIGKPFTLDHPQEKAEDEELVLGITNEIQRTFQNNLKELLKLRKSPFHQWDMEKVTTALSQVNERESV